MMNSWTVSALSCKMWSFSVTLLRKYPSGKKGNKEEIVEAAKRQDS